MPKDKDGFITVENKPRPKWQTTSKRTGTYEASFVAGGIAAADRTYQRSKSVGRFTTTHQNLVDATGKVLDTRVQTERTSRRHIHYGTDGKVHTPSHIPTMDGESKSGPLRSTAVRTYDKKK